MNDQTTKHDDERDEVARQLRYWHDIALRCDTNPQCTIHEHNELRVIVNALRTRYSTLTNGKAWPPRATAIALALFLALHALPAHATSAHDWHAPIPAGCAEVGHFEDGTVIAVCGELQSKVIAHDPDGQPYANTAGRAVREPGWYAIS